MSARRPGALALVLHSHMPYVEGFGTWPFGEEWLWEAVASVYLPLLDLVDGAPVTIGLTPVLCDQLEAMRGDAGERYLAFLRDIRAVIHAEDARGLERGGEPALAAEVRRAAGDYVCAERGLRAARARLVGAFAALEGVELWTSAATHALLPLLATDAGRRLQLATGTASHLRRFGAWQGGFWLPECAFVPGLERDLADHGRTRLLRGPDPVSPASITCVRWPPRRDRWRCRSTGRRSSWSGTTATAIPSAPPTATTTAAPSTTCGPGTTPAARTTARRREAQAREHARDFVDAGERRASRAAASSAARSTPSCSATGGTRGRPGSLPCSRRRRGAGPAAGDGERGIGLVEPGRRGARAVELGGTGRTCRPGTRPPSPSLRSRARRAELRTVASGVGARRGRAPRSSGRPGSCSRSSRATGPSWSPRDLASDYPASAPGGPRRRPRSGPRRSGRLRARSGSRPAPPRARPRPGLAGNLRRPCAP